MKPSDWIAIGTASVIGLALIPWHPGPGIVLITITGGSLAFARVMQHATRFGGP